MKKNLEKFSNNKLEELINDITSLVYDEKIWIWQEMWKVAEVTYSYVNVDEYTDEKITLNWKEVNLNTTLFVSLWKLNLENFIKSSDDEKIKKIKKASKKNKKKTKNKNKRNTNIKRTNTKNKYKKNI